MEEAEQEMKVISKVYNAPDGGKSVYKTYLDAKAIRTKTCLVNSNRKLEAISLPSF